MFFSILDIAIGIVASILLLAFGYFYQSTKSSEIYKQYYLKGLGLKLLGAIIFITVYVLVYGSVGDSYRFYLKGEILLNRVSTYPSEFFEILFSSKEDLKDKFTQNDLKSLGISEDFRFAKATMIMMILGFKNYFLMTLFAVVTSFYGSWKLFLALLKRYPNQASIIFLGIFLVPSVLFWSSTLMKDAFVLGFFNLFLALILDWNKKGKVIRTIILIALLLTLSQIKAYVIISFLPALMLFIFLSTRKRIKDGLIRLIFTPVMLALITTVAVLGMFSVGELSDRYKIEELESRTKGFHTWHTSLGGSAYDLGEIEYTAPGILSKAPEAISVSLIRPFPWEVKNAMMLVGAVESLIFIALMLYFILIKQGVFKWIKSIYKDPFMLSSFFFVIIFAFIVGFTSYNYGALFRYKIPCMAFYFLIVVLPYYNAKSSTQVSKS